LRKVTEKRKQKRALHCGWSWPLKQSSTPKAGTWKLELGTKTINYKPTNLSVSSYLISLENTWWSHNEILRPDEFTHGLNLEPFWNSCMIRQFTQQPKSYLIKQLKERKLI
jgi:hypothetical protein